jgi:hypothetical protein
MHIRDREHLLEVVDNEPNHEIYLHEGFLCEIKRHPSLLHLCGYIQVPPNHPWFGQEYIDVNVHGGITWGDKSEITGNWVLGFDCGHAGDISYPSVMLRLRSSCFDEEYRDWEYVKSQTNYLALEARKVYPVDDDINLIVNYAKLELITTNKENDFSQLPVF